MCLLAGAALLLMALVMLSQPWRAAWAADKTLAELKTQISAGNIGAGGVVEIGGYSYIGYLSIPEINRELPVMSDLTDSKLSVAPCRYYGDTATNDMVVGAHNYPGFFGHLKDLAVGDELHFTDAAGQEWGYTVDRIEVLSENQVEYMISSGYPLTLFTCTDDNVDRLTVRCTADPAG